MTTQQHRTQSGVISDFVVVAEDQKFRFSRRTTVRIVLPEDSLCCAQKAVEMFQDHELCPRFLQVAGPRLVQEMRQSDFDT
jgi:hypothetical protein